MLWTHMHMASKFISIQKHVFIPKAKRREQLVTAWAIHIILTSSQQTPPNPHTQLSLPCLQLPIQNLLGESPKSSLIQ